MGRPCVLATTPEMTWGRMIIRPYIWLARRAGLVMPVAMPMVAMTVAAVIVVAVAAVVVVSVPAVVMSMAVVVVVVGFGGQLGQAYDRQNQRGNQVQGAGVVEEVVVVDDVQPAGDERGRGAEDEPGG